MKLAAVLPSTDLGNDTAAVKDWAQAVEDLGFDRIVAYDHVLGAHPDHVATLSGPYTHEDPFREPLTLFAYLAGATRRVELMTGVLVLPQRQTALVAKQAAEVSLLSGGRLVLGVGVGWNPIEYESLGVDFAARGARLDEQVEILRRLWSEPVVDFHGRFHRIDRAGILPRPESSIPIWFGGSSERARRRAAKSGDGFFFTAVNESALEWAKRLLELSREQPNDASARTEPFGLAVQIHAAEGLAKCEADVRKWTAVSGTHIAVTTSPPAKGVTNTSVRLERHISDLAECATLVRSLSISVH